MGDVNGSEGRALIPPCPADITLRDEEHALIRCGKTADHTDAHLGVWEQDNYVEWTDADHH